MKFKWILSAALAGVLVAGCSTPIEDQLEPGFAASEQAFSAEAKEPNEKMDNIEFYLPEGFEAQKGEVENNYLLNDNGDLYVLFVNSLEDGTSKVAYDRLMADQEDEIVEVKTFESDKLFGYTAILEKKNDEYELVTAIGGVKVTTISSAKKIDEKLANMMTITKSVQTKNE